jgi:hypothetical protein
MRMTSRHPERSGEWSDWGCRDMDEKAEGCASGRRAHQIPVRYSLVSPRVLRLRSAPLRMTAGYRQL